MNDQTTPELWSAVDDLWEWLETNRPVEGREGLLLRILKLTEEVGEVSEAVIGATGQNPRKGVTHTWDDVRSELCDVVITALVALRTLTPDARGVFARHLERVTRRSLGTAPVPPPATGTGAARGGASGSADAELC
ncbi:MazG-like family protein [Streptomyces tuirus]|uniref:MazG-like family protein n=1 Tax=Streptomyces tuirus TaxID=68278 RepID=A0A941FJU2_9ACTN|nr:MazG-like family protein [Streptomyces tuirus]